MSSTLAFVLSALPMGCCDVGPSGMLNRMFPASRSDLTVGPVSPDEKPTMLRWLLDRSESSVSSCARFIPHLIQVVDASGLLGAVGINIMPGRTAALFGPRFSHELLATGGPNLNRAADELLSAANYYLQQHSVTMGQSLLDRGDSSQSQWYRAAGYDAVIELDFLVRVLDRDRRIAAPEEQAGVDWVEYSSATHDRFVATLERTYEGTQDCMVLNGIRDPNDVLLGHRAIGEFAPHRWLLMHVDHEDVGCLLLADFPSDSQWEMVYLGIMPEFRRRGLGAAATRHAIRLAAVDGRSRLTLAVDARNELAQRMYTRAGFVCWSQQQVQLRFF